MLIAGEATEFKQAVVDGYRAGRLAERVVRVDAVSSASREDRVESRARRLADLLRRRF